MKINKSKIVVSALAVCMGAALVGSVSGTVAWYQYSTKATTAMMGTAAGVSKNLEIRLGAGEWKQELTTTDVSTWLTTAGNTEFSKGDKLIPVTTSAIENNVELPQLKENPIFGYADPAQWADAEKTDYVVLPLHVRAVERDEANDTTPKYVKKNIYLTDLTIQNKVDSGKQDITKAVRVHFASGSNYALVSKDGADTNVYGNLDLNGDGQIDRSLSQIYDFQVTGTPTYLTYGENSKVAKSFAANSENLIANDDDADALTGGKLIATTPADEADGIDITVTIYLEGWTILNDQVLGGNSIWDMASYVGSQFYVGMQFGCNAGSSI